MRGFRFVFLKPEKLRYFIVIIGWKVLLILFTVRNRILVIEKKNTDENR